MMLKKSQFLIDETKLEIGFGYFILIRILVSFAMKLGFNSCFRESNCCIETKSCWHLIFDTEGAIIKDIMKILVKLLREIDSVSIEISKIIFKLISTFLSCKKMTLSLYNHKERVRYGL